LQRFTLVALDAAAPDAAPDASAACVWLVILDCLRVWYVGTS
jgi:hypothetical protein